MIQMRSRMILLVMRLFQIEWSDSESKNSGSDDEDADNEDEDADNDKNEESDSSNESLQREDIAQAGVSEDTHAEDPEDPSSTFKDEKGEVLETGCLFVRYLPHTALRMSWKSTSSNLATFYSFILLLIMIQDIPRDLLTFTTRFQSLQQGH